MNCTYCVHIFFPVFLFFTYEVSYCLLLTLTSQLEEIVSVIFQFKQLVLIQRCARRFKRNKRDIFVQS